MFIFEFKLRYLRLSKTNPLIVMQGIKIKSKMLSKLVRRPVARFLSTSAINFNSEAISVTRRDDYYKNLAAQNADTKPDGWDNAKPFEAIPGPKPIPVLGNMWRFFPVVGDFYSMSVMDMYKGLQRKHGNVVILKGIMGRKPAVLLFDPNDMEMFLRNAGPHPIRNGIESLVYYRTKIRDDVFQGVGGVLIVHGEEWFRVRSLVNPILMQPRVIQRYVGSMDVVANDLIENMAHFSKQNENNEMPEDFQNELYKWALESVAVVALNKRLGCLKLNLEKDSEAQKFIESVVQSIELMYYLEVRPPVWKFMNTTSWKKFVTALDVTTQTSVKYIEECLAEPIDESIPEDQLGVLQRLIKLDKRIAIAMVVDMLGAGIDTTGRTLAAALYFLAKNTDKQERLREEALKNLPTKDSPVTNEVLNNSPYLKAAIKETTRLAPIGLGNLRTSVKDMVLGGYRIPKDTELMSMNLLACLTDQFKEADKFIPERYLRDADKEYSYKNAHPFVSLPFGHGPRSCIGKRLANLELEVALAKIIRNFKLSWTHEDMAFDVKLLYGIANPLKVKVQPLEE